MNNKKKLILVLIALIAIIGVTVGVTWAFLSYTKEGVKENTITSGAITFHYNEDSNLGISLDNALPIDDATGKSQNKYFDFTITSNNNIETSIPYQITSRKENVANPLNDQYVKIYLTKVPTDNNDPETPVLFDTYNNLITLEYNNHDEEILWTDSVPANTVNYTQKYRLRIWLSDQLDFSPLKDNQGNYIEENGEYVYPNNDKEFSIKLNVYAGDAKQDEPPGPTISNISSSDGSISPVVDQSLGYDYVTEPLPRGTTNTSLNITTEDPSDTVTVEKLDGIALNDNQSNIRRLSTTKVIQLENLLNGDNFYKITIKNNKNVKSSYVIKVTVEQDTDATLSSLTVNGCELNETFNSNTTTYTCDVANNVSSIEVTATPNSPNATSVVVTGHNALTEGLNTVTITVTAEDITKTKVYSISVFKEESLYKTLSTAIFNRYPAANARTADLTKTSTAANENGLFVSTETNSGLPTYYFRGVANNYLTFAGNSFRIVRVNEDGSIRIVKSDSLKNANYYNPANVMKDWYNGIDKNYGDYISKGSSYFCNEKKFEHNKNNNTRNGAVDMPSDYIPNFRCSSYLNLNYGYLSAEEVLFAGNLTNNVNKNTSGYGPTEGYIYDIAESGIWLQSDGYFTSFYSFAISGDIGLHINNASNLKVKPVINLKPDVIVSGKGTELDPWTVQYN